MGLFPQVSFDVPCSLSALAIRERDAAGLTLLTNDLLAEDTEHHYQLFCPPIYGTYDGHGKLTDVKRTETVEMLEAFFDRDIDIILDCVAQSDDFYNHSEAIYFHYGTARVFVGEGGNLFDSLISYGMKKVSDDEHKTEYTFEHYTLTHDKDKGCWTVGRVTRAGTSRKLSSINSFGLGPQQVLEFFSLHTRMFPGFEKKHYPALRELRNLRGMFFIPEILSAVSETVVAQVWNTQRINLFTQLWNKALEQAPIEPHQRVHSLIDNDEFFMFFSSVYAPSDMMFRYTFNTYKSSSEILEGYVFKLVLEALGVPMVPTVLGSPEGKEVRVSLEDAILRTLKQREIFS